jgi:hypothetical protein
MSLGERFMPASSEWAAARTVQFLGTVNGMCRSREAKLRETLGSASQGSRRLAMPPAVHPLLVGFVDPRTPSRPL